MEIRVEISSLPSLSVFQVFNYDIIIYTYFTHRPTAALNTVIYDVINEVKHNILNDNA